MPRVDIRFDTTKHDHLDCIANRERWSNANIARWNKRMVNAHRTSVRAWADRQCKAHPPKKFKAVLHDKKTIARYRKLGVNWLDMELSEKGVSLE